MKRRGQHNQIFVVLVPYSVRILFICLLMQLYYYRPFCHRITIRHIYTSKVLQRLTHAHIVRETLTHTHTHTYTPINGFDCAILCLYIGFYLIRHCFPFIMEKEKRQRKPATSNKNHSHIADTHSNSYVAETTEQMRKDI